MSALAINPLTVPVPATAQRPARMPRIGFLGMDSQMQAERLLAFKEGLRLLGYVEDRNIKVEYRSSTVV